MNTFFFMTLTYLKRLTRDLKETSLLIIIPLGLIIINSLLSDGTMALEGYNVASSFNMPAFVLSFQFFNMGIMLHILFKDFKGDMRWRLRAAPHTLRTFIVPAFVASWIFSIFTAIVNIVISALFLGAYLGNILVFAAVLLLISLMATFLAMLIFLFTKKFAGANGVVYIVSFGLMIASGFMVPLGDSRLVELLISHTPMTLGMRAIINSGSLSVFPPWGAGMERSIINIGILGAMTAAIAIITLIAAGRRKI